MLIDKLILLLGADTTEWTKGTKKASNDIDGLKKKTEGFLSGLRGFRRTNLGESLEIAAGGGALRVFSEVGNKITETSNKIGEIRKAWEEGTASAGDMVETVAKGIPVVGSFWTAGRAIRELFTREAEEAKRVTEEIAAQNDAIKTGNLLLHDQLEIARKGATALAEMRGKNILRNMPDGIPKEIGTASLNRDKALEKLQQERDEGLRKINEKIAVSQFGKDAIAANSSLSNPGTDWIAQLKKRQDRLANEYAEAQKAVVDASKPEQFQPEMWAVNDTAIEAAQEKARRLSTELQNVRTMLAGATGASSALWKNFNEESNEVLKTAALDVMDAFGKPLTAAFDKASESLKRLGEEGQKMRAKNLEHLNDVAKELNNEGRTPLQQYLDEMKKIDTLRLIGKLSPGAHSELQARYKKEFEGALRADNPLAPYRQAPTVEHSLGNAGINYGLPTLADPVNKLVRTAEQQLQEQRKANALTEQQIKEWNSGAYVLSPG